MKFYKLSKNIKSDDGNIFSKDSVIQILTSGTKINPSVEVMPINAFDEEKLPFLNGTQIFTFSKFNENEHKQVKPMEAVIAEFGYPGNTIDNEPDEDSITIGLRDAYADKDYELTLNGNVQKKNQLQKEADAFNDNVGDESTTDFSTSVEGEDDPGVTDNYKEDVNENPTPAPLAGALSRKIKSLKKKISSEENHLTATDDDSSIDFDSFVDGSGTVDSGAYSADESTKPTPTPMLGELAKLKRQNKKLLSMLQELTKQAEEDKDEKDEKEDDKKKEKEAIKKQINKLKAMIVKAEGEFKIDNVSDGDSGGKNLDDFSREDNIEGAEDEFSPKEAKKKSFN